MNGSAGVLIDHGSRRSTPGLYAATVARPVSVSPAARPAVRSVQRRPAASSAENDAGPATDIRTFLTHFGFAPNDAADLAPLMASRRFEAGEVVQDRGAAAGQCHFVCSGIISITCAAEDGIEVGTILSPGFVGIPVVLGSSDTRATYPLVARTEVNALSIDADALNSAITRAPSIQRTLFCYAEATMNMVLRRAACHATHKIEGRIASWLLVSATPLSGKPLRITHDQLSRSLGVRRATVTNALHLLEGERAIYANRCRITVRDAGRLAMFSCGCHAAVIRGERGTGPRFVAAAEA